ncbi:ABC transporter substrate-binding protein [Methyloparacoccus murrellii]
MHSTKTKFWLAYGLALVWLLTLSRAAADEHLAAPQRVIQETADQLQVSLQKPEYKADFKKATALVDQIIYPHVDFDRVSILVLGKHWRSATPEQRERFKREFRMLLVRTYTTAFTEYANWKIRYLPLDEASDKKALVKTEILQSGGQPVAVNYRMVREGTDWKVYDVLIEGISLLQNYRTSFNDEVEQTGSLDQLIAHLSERNSGAMREPVGSGNDATSAGKSRL